MSFVKWTAVALAFIEAGWMTFDGTRALLVGDYVTPRTGQYAGQLGPWIKIVSAAGIEPRSVLMKATFVLYGVSWLIVIGCFVLDYGWARQAMLIAAVGSLWYLWVGTVSSLIVIVLLLLSVVLDRA